MTEEEKSGIVHEVIETIKGQSQDITELPVSDNIEDFTSLPVVAQDGTLKKMSVTMLKGKKGDKGENGINGTNGADGRLRLQNHGTNDKVFALTPNVMHVWGVVDSLTLTLSPNTDTRFVAEYCFQFTCPTDNGTQLTLSSSVKWLGNVFAPKKGQTYQACIVNGLLLIGGTL
jgi:hypothetical protein